MLLGMLTDDVAAAGPENSGPHLNCIHIFFCHRACTFYFAFVYQEMQTTQLYQLLHPLRTWSFLSELTMLQ
jgi:hypothetical protein